MESTVGYNTRIPGHEEEDEMKNYSHCVIVQTLMSRKLR